MKDYYILKSDKRISDAIQIKGTNKVINIDYVKTNRLQFIEPDPVMFYIEDKGIYPDFIEEPLPLISNRFWTVLNEMKVKSIFFKPVCLTDVNKMTSHLYWLIVPDKINCLSKNSEFYKNGTLKTLKIDREKAGYYKVFKVNGILEDYIIVDEDVVNALEIDYRCIFTKVFK